MHHAVISDVREIPPLLEEVELAVARLYGACAERFAGDAAFWRMLMYAERQHAACVREGGEVIAREPERFPVDPGFDAGAVREFIENIDRARGLVESGSIDERRALLIASEIEGSYIEERFADTVYGRDPALLAMLARLARETAMHKKLLADKLDAMLDGKPVKG